MIQNFPLFRLSNLSVLSFVLSCSCKRGQWERDMLHTAQPPKVWICLTIWRHHTRGFTTFCLKYSIPIEKQHFKCHTKHYSFSRFCSWQIIRFPVNWTRWTTEPVTIKHNQTWPNLTKPNLALPTTYNLPTCYLLPTTYYPLTHCLPTGSVVTGSVGRAPIITVTESVQNARTC